MSGFHSVWGWRFVRLASSGCVVAFLGTILVFLTASEALAHVVAAGDRGYILCTDGIRVMPFAYLGAKHMITGYDHLLFLFGVMFFLYRARDVAVYVTLFALGHSITLISGVLSNVHVNPFLIDGIIALSVVYKALDNLGAFTKWLGVQPNAMAATMFFGLCHGLGLATKMIDFELPRLGLMQNLIAFNVGVEAGQLLALAGMLLLLNRWRATDSFVRHARGANIALAVAGLGLLALQLSGYVTGGT